MDYFNMTKTQKSQVQAGLFRRMRIESQMSEFLGLPNAVEQCYQRAIALAVECQEYEMAQALKDSMQKYTITNVK